MKTVCEKDMCTGCMACIESCTKNAISLKDSVIAYNAQIDEKKCIKCGKCYKTCPNNNQSNFSTQINWYQGWSNDYEVRKCASSGGVATELSKTFINMGGVVYSCSFSDGEFRFTNAKTIEELNKFVGSKYVKSSPLGIHNEIKELLRNNELVLFIGLPCQVAALKNYVGNRLKSNLYTIDLICHGTPSPQMLELFLGQYNISLNDIDTIQFRHKANYQITREHNGIVTNGVSDRYSIAFLYSLINTENCYSCKYATDKRVSDITLGDSWGSLLSEEEKERGISLILSQSNKGEELLQKANVTLLSVDVKNAILHNQQLSIPAIKNKNRKVFFKSLMKGKKFNRLVFRCLPKQCIKQDVKNMLIKLKIICGKTYDND